MTVVEDYQAILADGTVLAAKRNAGAAQLAQALDPSTRIQFLRVKNSWGTGGNIAFVPGMRGYNDLYIDYLAGTVGGNSAFMKVVFPPGY